MNKRGPSQITSYRHKMTTPSVQWRADWRKAFLTAAKHVSLLWMTLTRGPSILAS